MFSPTVICATKPWYTKKITDRNGNYTNVSYKASNNSEISVVSTRDNRRINFYYSKGSSDRTSRLNKITAGNRFYSFTYTAIPNLGIKEYWLKKVTRPDGKSWNYEYYGNLNGEAGSYALKKVTYPLGGSVTYEYDNVEFYADGSAFVNTGSNIISKKSVSTGGTWIYDYKPARYTGSYDTTTISTPKGSIVYQHTGANTVSNGSVWKIGLLASKKTGSFQTETYSYLPQKISDQNNQRSGLFLNKIDQSYYAPLLSQKKITRSGQNYTTNYSSHDTYGNPRSIQEAGSNGGNRTTSVTYYTNTTKWIINQAKNESRSGTSIIRDFYSDGNLRSISNNGVKTSYAYDSEGNVSSITYPRNATHRYSNYKRGTPRSETQPESVMISRVVDNYGNITSETNGENETTRYQHDLMNRITLIDYPLGSNVSVSYSGAAKTTRRGSYAQTETYDGFGRVKKVDQGSGVFSQFSYDNMGMREFASNPGSSGTGKRYTYDLLGRLTGIRFADGGSASLSYSGANVSYRDAKGKTTTYRYRAYGNPDHRYLMGITAPVSSANMTYGRNNRDLIETMRQGNITRIYAYYSNNYLRSITHPETGLTTYGRDAAGNMTSMKVGSTSATSFTYDQRNRLKRINYPSGTPSVSRDYDKADRIKSISNSQATRRFDYDNNGNLTIESLAVDGLFLKAVNGYNSNDYLDSITYPKTNTTVRYGVNTLGRPTSVSGYVNSVAYWPSGQLSRISFSNGITSSFGENNRLLVDKLTVRGSSTFVNNSYSYDKNGNLEAINDTLGSAHDRAFSYDAINRIDSARGSWGSGNFDYRDAGNFSSQTLGSTRLTYGYDSSNKLTSVSGSQSSTIRYDGYGNIKEMFGKRFVFDAASNLSCENCDANDDSRQHYYDGLNYRYKTLSGGHAQYEFRNASGLLLLAYSPTKGEQTVEYVYLNGKRIAQHLKGSDLPVKLQVKTLLQGAYNPSASLMRDDLRVDGLIPTNDPYGTNKSLNSALLNTTGNNAIVDWVLLELRNADNPSTVAHTYAALLQRDGDVVDPTSGSNTLEFNTPSGSNFYVSIRHRNHLGVMTATAQNMAEGSTTVIDFTATTTTVTGQHARSETQGKALMWAGDANHDEKVINQGIGNDPSVLLTNIFLAPGNSNGHRNYQLGGYLSSDLNLDGVTVYYGPRNDNNLITSNVLFNPRNSNFSSNYIVRGGMVNVAP